MDTLSHRIQSALSHLLHRGGQLPAQRPTVAVDRTVLTLHGEGGAAWSGEGQVGRWRLRTARAIRDG
ncbi:MAG: hypothetical protein KC613_09175, partial [Myxococcales bacterium]|nr:hypothetical protein [Myxococcales bacterium]